MRGYLLIPIATKDKDNSIKICLLGPSFDTGNLGVNALVEASIKAIVNRWPDAEVTLLGSGCVDSEYRLSLFGREIQVKSMPIRFCTNVLLPNHFMVLLLYGMILKIFRGHRLREALSRRNAYLRTILEANVVFDNTGGDSFSDIYGMGRFIKGFLRKWLVKVFQKPLVLLPQTYGPFNRRLTKVLARQILDYATLVYSRDRRGLEDVRKLIGEGRSDDKIKFVPDVGFLLDPRRPAGGEIESIEKLKSGRKTLVGLNVSGLLSCISDSGDNVFKLQVNYPALIDSILEFLMKQEGTAVLLVPHVVPMRKPGASHPKSVHVHRKGYREQSDAVVCGALYERVVEKYPGRIFIVRGHYNHNETKYIIGLCDFFIGSRMHACIAALSQGIPAVGIAYSGKFQGVFESVGVGDCVADARQCREDELLEKISSAFQRKGQIRENLRRTVPRAKSEVLDMFKTLEL
jgi:polysaccharide pyruvyl transferase WcaK-like protein